MPRISMIFTAPPEQARDIERYCSDHGLTLAQFARLAAVRMVARAPTKAERAAADRVKVGRPRSEKSISS